MDEGKAASSRHTPKKAASEKRPLQLRNQNRGRRAPIKLQCGGQANPFALRNSSIFPQRRFGEESVGAGGGFFAESSLEVGLFEAADAVAKLGGFFEFEILGGFAHLRFKFLEKIGELFFVSDIRSGSIEFGFVDGDGDVISFDDVRQLHVHALDDGLRRDVVFRVVGELLSAAAICFVDCFIHRLRAAVGVKNGAAFDVARTAANRLNERGRAAQKAFLVGIENGDEGNFGKVEAFTQQVDADEDVEFTAAQVAKDFDAIERFDFRVQVAAADADFREVFAKVFSHAFGERGDQDALVFLSANADFFEQIVHLSFDRADFDLRVDEAGWADDLFDERAAGTRELIRTGRRRNINHLIFIDESHQTIPQLQGMFHGDRSRKDVLVQYGFRLPSARDNRPLTFEDFENRVNQVVYVSATPGPYELNKSAGAYVEQIIRPTGLVDPVIDIKPIKGQVDDLLNEIRVRSENNERVLVTTLTKRMAEDLAEYYAEVGVKCAYLHSEVSTLDRIRILRDLRRGEFDALIGVNLLREGLDLPEVSLVAILDADKEGFLRSAGSLIQTIGRAARNLNGRAILYADVITDSMRRAIDETNRRRHIQEQYNIDNEITPQSIIKPIDMSLIAVAEGDYVTVPLEPEDPVEEMTPEQRERFLRDLEETMREAARKFDFKKAAEIRDRIKVLRTPGKYEESAGSSVAAPG